MKVCFLTNRQPREQLLGAALNRGLMLRGDRLQTVPYHDRPEQLDCDAIAFVGVKCREWHEYCQRTGTRFLYFDKGYHYPKEKSTFKRNTTKIVNCWRISVDTNQPLEQLAQAKHTLERWDKMGPRPKPWREPTPNGPIIIAGSSPKFHLFHGLPDPTTWAQEIVAELRRHTDRPIHYRPKPSWWVGSPEDAVPIDGTEFIPTLTFEERAAGAHAIITYGSNAAMIGMLQGVPSVIVGNGIMRVVSSTDLSEIEAPYLAPEEDRLQLLANIAWSQYTLLELGNGKAWGHIKELFLQ